MASATRKTPETPPRSEAPALELRNMKNKVSQDKRGASKHCSIIKMFSPSADKALRADSHLHKQVHHSTHEH